jgi:serine phosphatase RsbU (regulator of sigma subunit)/transcriptional regulator with GAF, ATPase, and Fis domain
MPIAANPPSALALVLSILLLLVLGGLILVLARVRSIRNEHVIELEAISEFQRTFARTPLEADELAEVAYEEAARFMPADYFQLGLFDHDSYRTVIWIKECNCVENQTFPLKDGSEGIVGWVRRSGQPLLVSDFEAEKERLPAQPAYSGNDPVSSALFVPLVAGEEVFGVIAVQSRRARAYRQHHLRLLAILGNAAAAALSMSGLQGQASFLSVQLALARRVAMQLTSLQPVPELMSQVAALMHETFGHHHIHIFEKVDEDLILRATSNPESAEAAQRIPIGVDLVGQAVAEATILTRPNVGQSFAAAALPLKSEEHVLGAIELEAEPDHLLSPHHIQLAEMIAAQLTIAILEARNYAQQQEEAWVTTVLLEVARHAARPGDTDEALQAVLQLTTLLAGSAWAVLLLPCPQPEFLRVGPVAGLGRQHKAELEELRLPTSLFNLPLTDDDSLGPRRVRVPVGLANHVHHADSALALAVSDGISLLGILLLEDQELKGRRPALLSGIGRQVGLRLENTRLIEAAAVRRTLEREVAMARGIQESFLPRSVPSHPGWEMGTTWLVAREVGGDFYDFIPLAPGPDGPRWGIVIADVADKGVPAALVMALCRTLLRSVAISRIDPGITLTRLNELIIADTQTDLFVSVFYAVWEPGSGRLSYANGGHNPPLLFGASDTSRDLPEHGMLLGVEPDASYQTHSLTLAPESLLVLFTDGVTEAADPQGEFFGLDRLRRLILDRDDWRAQAVADSIASSVLAFSGESYLADDLTAVVLRRTKLE